MGQWTDGEGNPTSGPGYRNKHEEELRVALKNLIQRSIEGDVRDSDINGVVSAINNLACNR
jgi:hypothetical protein